MSVIKVRDLAFGRLRSPDLDQEEEFLTAFGMVRAARTPTALYMRGTDPATTSTSPRRAIRRSSASPGMRATRTTSAWRPNCRAPRASSRSTSPAAASACV